MLGIALEVARKEKEEKGGSPRIAPERGAARGGGLAGSIRERKEVTTIHTCLREKKGRRRNTLLTHSL